MVYPGASEEEEQRHRLLPNFWGAEAYTSITNLLTGTLEPLEGNSLSTESARMHDFGLKISKIFPGFISQTPESRELLLHMHGNPKNDALECTTFLFLSACSFYCYCYHKWWIKMNIQQPTDLAPVRKVPSPYAPFPFLHKLKLLLTPLGLPLLTTIGATRRKREPFVCQ